MADHDMADNGVEIHDAAMRIGILSQRTTNLETIVGDVRRELGHSISALNQSIAAMSSKVDERFNTLSSSMAERQRPQWQALGVMLTAMVVLGGLLYWPIREGQSRIDTSLTRLQDTAISRGEWSDNMARAAENRHRLESAIAKLAENAVGRNELTQMVTEYRDYKARIENELGTKLARNEWAERNASRDHDIENLQRQIDLQRSDFLTFSNSLGNGRDFIRDLKEEVSRLRDQLAEIRARQYQRLPPP